MMRCSAHRHSSPASICSSCSALGSGKARSTGRQPPDTQQFCIPLLQGTLQLLVVRLQLVSLRSQAVQTVQLAAHADNVLCLPELSSLTLPESTMSGLQSLVVSCLTAATLDI